MEMPSRWFDFGCAMAISLLMEAVVFIVGDWMYAGWCYYLMVPIGFCVFASVFRVKPMFVSGTAAIMVMLFLPYILVNLFAAHPDDLIVLGHLFSLPGAAVGLMVSVVLSRRYADPLRLFFCPMWLIALGFLLNQLLVCNTVAWCGLFLSFCHS